MGREAFVGTEKTGKEHYTLWSMVVLLLLILALLKKHLFTTSFPAIFGYVLPVRAAI
jgi:hypothetical protein